MDSRLLDIEDHGPIGIHGFQRPAGSAAEGYLIPGLKILEFGQDPVSAWPVENARETVQPVITVKSTALVWSWQAAPLKQQTELKNMFKYFLGERKRVLSCRECYFLYWMSWQILNNSAARKLPQPVSLTTFRVITKEQ
jgi:hypothetical protein